VVVRGGRPQGRVINEPPELAIEVLSPEDRALDVQEKIDDYLAFGIPSVWLIDPERQRAWVHTPAGAHEASNRILSNPAGDLQVPLSAIFPEPL
jgi:Uma2 family endonuclease